MPDDLRSRPSRSLISPVLNLPSAGCRFFHWTVDQFLEVFNPPNAVVSSLPFCNSSLIIIAHAEFGLQSSKPLISARCPPAAVGAGAGARRA